MKINNWLFYLIVILFGCELKQNNQNKEVCDTCIVFTKYNDSLIKIYNEKIRWDTGFYSNGKIEYIYGVNFSDLKTGPYFNYYENGKIKIQGHFLNDSQFGDWNFYNAGKTMAYQLYDSLGKLKYICEYKADKISREDGKRLTINHSIAGNIVSFMIFRANPPMIRNEIYYINNFLLNGVKYSEREKIQDFSGNYHLYKKRFHNNSMNQITFILKSKDNYGKIQNDTLFYSLDF
ncbi:MAG: hypothetical protein Q8R57_15540 [Bacteroidota bacterium]|nr:hypothetical protein [Bacteroidota bacterium]